MDGNKNNFDDIILDKTNKSEKIKKILLRIIALAILFLIVMIVMKLINSSDTSSQNTSDSIFPSEPQTPMDKPFNEIPITDSNTSDIDEFEALRQRLQGLDENISIDNNFTMPNTLTDSNETKTQAESILPPEPPKKGAEVKTKDDIPKSDKTPTATKNQESSKKQETKKTEDTKELFSNIKTTSKLEAGMYIQVFSVATFDPKSKELALLGKNGYKHKLYKTTVNGKEITRVLVGPFSKDNINDELKNIREKVEKEAFVFQVK